MTPGDYAGIILAVIFFLPLAIVIGCTSWLFAFDTIREAWRMFRR